MTDHAGSPAGAEATGLERLHQLYASLATGTDLQTALQDILAAAVELTGTDRGVLQRVSADGERLEIAVHYGYGEGTRFTEHFRYEGAKAACDSARAHRQRMIIEDIGTFPALDGTIDREVALSEDIHATLSVPMLSRGAELIGVLNTQFRQVHRPSDRELRVMDMLAWTAAGFIERHEASDTALRTSEERYRTLFDSIDEGFYFARALFDADGRCTDILYDDENPAAIRMTRRSAKGRRLSELGDYEDYWRDIFGAVARTGDAQRLEHYAAPDGIWYDFYVFKPPQAGPDEFAVVFRDVSERKRAEEALRASEQRQAFLLTLSDALRPVTDAGEIVATASEALGRHLGAGQVIYAESDLSGEHVTMEREWNDGSIASNARRHRLDDFGPGFIADLKGGQSTAIADVTLDPRTCSPEALATFARASIKAFLNIPLMKGGELVAVLGVHGNAPRAWKAEDVAIAEQVAERIWAAVERARAEAALRTSEERLRSAVAIETVGVLFWGAGFRLEEVNQAFLAMTGFSHDEALGLTWQELTPPEFHQASERAVAQIQSTGRADPYEKQYFRKDGSRWWGLFAPRRLADGAAVEFVVDITGRRTQEQALRDSEQRLRLIVDSALDYAIFTTDPDGRVTGWWGGAENVFGWSPEEALDASADMTFTPEDRAKGDPQEERRIAREAGRAANVRWHLRKDGSQVFIEGFVVPLHAETGELTGFLKIGQDVTQRMRGQEHERMLLSELQHRVRNTLAVVRSITGRTAHSSASVEEMSDHLQGRLAAFSRVQAAVTRDPEGGVDLTNLIQDELLAHAVREGPKLRVSGDDVSLQPKAAESISLAIHELTTNAVKYGALSGQAGRLEIAWRLQGADGARELHFVWTEHDLPSPPRAGHEGFGTELLLRSLPYELDADTRIEFGPDGMRFEMTVPAERALTAADLGGRA